MDPLYRILRDDIDFSLKHHDDSIVLTGRSYYDGKIIDAELVYSKDGFTEEAFGKAINTLSDLMYRRVNAAMKDQELTTS